MPRNMRIIELADSGLASDLMAQPAITLSSKQLQKLLWQSQYKSENQGIYVAKYNSYDAKTQTFDAKAPYDQYLATAIDQYLAQFDQLRASAQQHFHQEMSVGYVVELFIARLHRRFEKHQDADSLVMVDGYEKELPQLK